MTEPVELERRVQQFGRSSHYIYIPREHLELSGVEAGVFEIEGIPMTLNRQKARVFTLPTFAANLLSVEAGDSLTVRVLGVIRKTRLESDSVQNEEDSQ